MSLVKSLTRLGKTQTEIVEIVRWSRSVVSNYLALRSIDADAGRMVVDTTKASMVPTGDGDAV